MIVAQLTMLIYISIGSFVLGGLFAFREDLYSSPVNSLEERRKELRRAKISAYVAGLKEQYLCPVAFSDEFFDHLERIMYERIFN